MYEEVVEIIEKDGFQYEKTTIYKVSENDEKEVVGQYESLIPEESDTVEPEPTEEELVQAEILLNQAEILAKQNEQDEVLAEILLNQMGV